MHGGAFQHPSTSAQRAVDYLREYMDAQDHLSVPDPIHVPAQQTWHLAASTGIVIQAELRQCLF